MRHTNTVSVAETSIRLMAPVLDGYRVNEMVNGFYTIVGI